MKTSIQIFVLTVVAGAFVALAACSDDSSSANSGDEGHSAQQHEAQQSSDSAHDSNNEAGSHDSDGHDESEHNEGAQGHEDSADDADVINLTATQLERLEISIAKASSTTSGNVITAPATVEFDADRIARVGPRLEAKVVEVLADLGDSVASGDRLAILESVALGKAKARHLTTLARLETARANYEREKSLNEKEITSEAELLEARAVRAEARAEHQAADEELKLYGLSSDQIDNVEPGAEQPLSRYVLKSPIGGVVQHRDLSPGQTISARETPFLIVDTESMWLMIEASESQVPTLEIGQKVSLKVRSLPDRSFSGAIDWVSSQLDMDSRTVGVRARLPNEGKTLRAGMFGTASIQATTSQRVARVPDDAVQQIKTRNVVFIPLDETGSFRAVAVETGGENAGEIEILSGIAPGDKVVMQGSFDLKSALTASGRSASHSH